MPLPKPILGDKFLHTHILRVHQVGILSPQKQHAVPMHLRDHAVQLGSRRTRLARVSQAMHLKEREAELGHL